MYCKIIVAIISQVSSAMLELEIRNVALKCEAGFSRSERKIKGIASVQLVFPHLLSVAYTDLPRITQMFFPFLPVITDQRFSR